MSKGKIIGLVLLGFVVVIGLVWGMGYLGVGYTKTVGKAQKNADTEVFYETQQYVRSMTIDAQDMYREYQKLGTDEERRGYKQIVAQHFADFNEEEHLQGKIRDFIHDCKYN